MKPRLMHMLLRMDASLQDRMCEQPALDTCWIWNKGQAEVYAGIPMQ